MAVVFCSNAVLRLGRPQVAASSGLAVHGVVAAVRRAPQGAQPMVCNNAACTRYLRSAASIGAGISCCSGWSGRASAL